MKKKNRNTLNNSEFRRKTKKNYQNIFSNKIYIQNIDVHKYVL